MTGSSEPLASARHEALSALARLLTERPWAVSLADIDRLREAGLSDEGIEQAISVASFFNYFTRVADGTGIDFDYDSPLPRIRVDRSRPPAERPPPEAWPALVDGSTEPPFARRPQTVQAVRAWRALLLESDEPLSRRDRLVIARAAAVELCDRGALARWADAAPADAREQALAAYASRLTLAPWQIGRADLEPLRALGLGDRALLHVIALTAHQNALSRFHHGLAALR